MKPDRHRVRILMMQLLCQLDVQGEGGLEHLDDFLIESDDRPATLSCARRMTRECWEQHADLDRRISDRLERWELVRLSPVERNVIRVALLELAAGDVPPKVIINEAIEIGREFGGADSPGFINGVLDAIWKHEREAASRGAGGGEVTSGN